MNEKKLNQPINQPMKKHHLKRYVPSVVSFVVRGILILAQFGWIVYALYRGTALKSWINVALQVAAIILAAFICSRDIRTSHKLSWTFVILALPIIGIPMYYITGRPELTVGKRKRMARVLERSKAFKSGDATAVEELREENADAFLQSEYIANYGGYPLYREAETTYFESGEAMFPKLLEDLRKAKSFIFVEFFILGTGEMLDAVMDILTEKAAEGVEVRVIFDDFGSIQGLPLHFDRILEAKGIRAIRFNPFRPLLSIIMNNRDHRKIVVVDNQIAYTGGVNLSDEYINRVERFGYWKDAAVRITGEACNNFTTMFLEMWEYAKKEKEKSDYAKYLLAQPVETMDREGQANRGFVQPYGDSPLDHEYVGETVYLNMISRAHKYIYIATPYLIIGTELTSALVTAAKSGVDVRILVPGIPDKKMTYQLTRSNFRHLIRGGVKIYTYTPGFVHTKCFVCDDLYATVGSINLDYRSLTLHFECGSFHYRTAAVPQVKEDLTRAIEASHRVYLEETSERHLLPRTVLMILKVFSPLF